MNLKHLKHLETLTRKISVKELNDLIENREEVTEELLQIIEYTYENAYTLCEEGSFILHIIAMYTLAYFRETRAYSGIIAIAKLPSEIIEPLLEDTITEGLAGILASVYDGNVTLIKEIIDNIQCDKYVRKAAIRSLVALIENKVTDKDVVIQYFKDHVNEGSASINIERILDEGIGFQEDKLVSKEDVLGLAKWLGVY